MEGFSSRQKGMSGELVAKQCALTRMTPFWLFLYTEKKIKN